MTTNSRIDLVTAQNQILAERYQERAAFELVWGMSFLDCLRRARIAEEIIVRWTNKRTGTEKEQKVYARSILGTDWPIFLKSDGDNAELVERGWLLDTTDVLAERFGTWILNDTGKRHYDAMSRDELQITWVHLVAYRVAVFRLLERKMQKSERGELGFADEDTAIRMREMMLFRQVIEQGARGAHHYQNGERDIAEEVINRIRDTCAEMLVTARQSYKPLPPLMQPPSLIERKSA